MRTIGALAAAVLVLPLALLGAGPASAATEVGHDCVGNAFATESTFVQRSTAESRPLSVPAPGVVTKWTANLKLFPGSVLHSFKVLRPTATSQFRVVAEAYGRLRSGSNSFDARIPVQKGDRFGLGGAGDAVYCAGLGESEEMWSDGADLPLGNSGSFVLEPKAGVPLIAAVEPDADGDGYGDETQDGCPQSAAAQSACPAIELDLFALRRKRSVLVLASSSREAAVRVSAFARTPKGRRAAKRRARGSAQARLPARTRRVGPGRLVRFNLPFTKRLRNALARLPRTRSLPLRIAARATDATGLAAVERLNLRLPGRRRP